MIKLSIRMALAFFWLPMTLNLRKMKRLPLNVSHHLVKMWAVLILKLSKVKVKVKYRNHIPLSNRTLILVEEKPLVHEFCLVSLQNECVFYKPKASKYGLPQRWLDVISVSSLKDLPANCIMVLEDLTQEDLDDLSQQKAQIMKISITELGSILEHPTKIVLECAVPLSVEESAFASIEIIRNY